MRTVTVTIGRNVGPNPLPAESWNEFVAKTRWAVQQATSEIWATAPYQGAWEGEREDAVVFYGPLDPDYGITLAGSARYGPDGKPVDAVRDLRTTLSNLATYYKQEAIGLSVGESELVEAWQAETTEAAA